MVIGQIVRHNYIVGFTTKPAWPPYFTQTQEFP
jgi:hypothetical protein